LRKIEKAPIQRDIIIIYSKDPFPCTKHREERVGSLQINNAIQPAWDESFSSVTLRITVSS